LVDVVVLKVSRANGDVIVGSEGFGRLPAVKRRPDENPFWAAKRVLCSVLRISENLVTIDPNHVLFAEEEAASQAYMGLPTIYRKLVIPATVVNA